MTDLFFELVIPAASAISLAASLTVAFRFQTLLRKLKADRTLPRVSGPSAGPSSAMLDGLKWEIGALHERICGLEAAAETGSSSTHLSIRSGMNLNKRTQALRQYRLGQEPGEIANSLDMPKAEVDLLVKVHKIISQSAAG